MLLKAIVFLFAVVFVAKLLFFRNREKLKHTVDRFANLFLVAIGLYILIYGLIQIF